MNDCSVFWLHNDKSKLGIGKWYYSIFTFYTPHTTTIPEHNSPSTLMPCVLDLLLTFIFVITCIVKQDINISESEQATLMPLMVD